MKKLLSRALAIAVFLATATALADGNDTFGDRRTITISGQLSAGTTKVGETFTLNGVSFQPEVSYFVARDLSISIGGLFEYDRYEDAGGITRRIVGGGSIALGHLVRLGDRVALWPKLGAHRSHVAQKIGSDPSTIDAFGFGGSIPVVFTVSEHLYATLSLFEAGYDWQTEGDFPASHNGGFAIGSTPQLGIGGWF